MAGNSTHTVGWDSGPDGRGTLNIIWTCLSTLFICVWTSWHLDYPADGDGTLKIMWQKLKWVSLLLLVPEYGIMVATSQLAQSRKYARILRERGRYEWTSLHCLFATMGGLRIRNEACVARTTRTAPSWAVQKPDTTCWCDNAVLRASNLVELDKMSLLPPTPPFSLEDIKKRGKADTLVKAIALLQVFWVLAQCIGRAAQHLPISELEIVVISYIFFCSIIYLCWWQKPLDAAIPIYIKIDHTEALDDQIGKVTIQPEITAQSVTASLNSFWDSDDLGWSQRGSVDLIMAVAVFVLFGSIHFLSWNGSFPTDVEKWLWRGSAIVMTSCLPLIVLYLAMKDTMDAIVDSSAWLRRFIDGSTVSKILDEGEQALALLLVCFYVCARLYILVEAFNSLRSSPPGLYDTVDWIKFIPHLS